VTGAGSLAVFVEKDTFHLMAEVGAEIAGQQPQQGAIGALRS
jgi:hypothetical protein